MSLLKKKRFWIGIFMTGLFLYLVFRQVDVFGLKTALVHADYRWLVPALIVYLLGYVLRAIRWQYLMHTIKRISWQQLFPPLILGFMFNNVFPARAGEFVRAYVVGKRENISKSAVFATVIMQRAYDGLVMVLFAGVVLYFYHLPETQGNAEFVQMINLIVNLTTLLFVAMFIILFAIITWKKLATTVLGKLTRMLPEKIGRPVDKIFGSLLDGFSVLKSKRNSMLAFTFSVLAWSGESAAYYFVLRAFGLELPAYVAIMLMAVVNLGIMIPSSPGYIGPFEFFGVGTLMLFGIVKSTALPCILVIHTLVWLPITLWGFYYMWTMKLSFREMEAKAQESAGI
ncbi:flippase-like domain-containing protein [bacterium]|nr:flippase-like domain-containing protein [bacterium]